METPIVLIPLQPRRLHHIGTGDEDPVLHNQLGGHVVVEPQTDGAFSHHWDLSQPTLSAFLLINHEEQNPSQYLPERLQLLYMKLRREELGPEGQTAEG